MKSTGIVRKIDDLGRIVLPVEMRRIFDINEKDSFEVLTEGDMIILKKYGSVCVLCGSSDDLKSFKDKGICSACIKSMKKSK